MAEMVAQDTFEAKVLQADKPVLVDFYADWCGPCKMMAPVLEKLAEEKAEQMAVYKLNVDENPELARQYRVMGIPTMILYKGGEVAAKITGAMSESELWAKLEGEL